MSAPDSPSQAQAPKTANLKPNQALIGGKVLEVRLHNKQFYTHVVQPAADEFSSPSHVEIISAKRIANKEDHILQICTVGGFLGKQFKITNEDTGEVTYRKPVVLTLRAVE